MSMLLSFVSDMNFFYHINYTVRNHPSELFRPLSLWPSMFNNVINRIVTKVKKTYWFPTFGLDHWIWVSVTFNRNKCRVSKSMIVFFKKFINKTMTIRDTMTYLPWIMDPWNWKSRRFTSHLDVRKRWRYET